MIADVQFCMVMNYDVWKYLKDAMEEWEEATKGMTEAEIETYYDSIYGEGAYREDGDPPGGWGIDSEV